MQNARLFDGFSESKFHLNHSKSIMVDVGNKQLNRYLLCGGQDLCGGRFDTKEHDLIPYTKVRFTVFRHEEGVEDCMKTFFCSRWGPWWADQHDLQDQHSTTSLSYTKVGGPCPGVHLMSNELVAARRC